MTHQEHPNALDQVLELLIEHGFDGMANACRVLFNEAMKVEWADVLQAQPYARTENRRGYADGFKPKTVQTRLGTMTLDVPQTRRVAVRLAVASSRRCFWRPKAVACNDARPAPSSATRLPPGAFDNPSPASGRRSTHAARD